jgi:nucleotide-binding universal stress UspA family protein
MGAYQTVAVGTDGSESSFRAVDRAAALAADAQATLLIICAYHPERDTEDAEHALGEESAYMVVGSSPAEQTLSKARDRAASAGALNVDSLAVEGNPVEVVTKVVSDRKADLVVIGNKGLNSFAGRLLGSVPQSVSRQASCDVLIVHTT